MADAIPARAAVCRSVTWDHPDAEMRLLLAICELCDDSMINEAAQARVFEYLKLRAIAGEMP